MLRGNLNNNLSHLKMYHQEKNKIEQFQTLILSYYDAHGRKTLPWRQDLDPWKILIAEFLLRKTTVAQANMVFNSIASLKPSDITVMQENSIINLIRPLGIYNVRARQLRALAESILKIPPEQLKSQKILEGLPGAGRYTANAVLCFSFGLPKPAFDTNMIRLTCRVFGKTSRTSRPRQDQALWDFAEKLVPKSKSRNFNWGVLDFAGSVCKARNPMCKDCLLQKICCYYNDVARSNNLQN